MRKFKKPVRKKRPDLPITPIGKLLKDLEINGRLNKQAEENLTEAEEE